MLIPTRCKDYESGSSFLYRLNMMEYIIYCCLCLYDQGVNTKIIIQWFLFQVRYQRQPQPRQPTTQ